MAGKKNFPPAAGKIFVKSRSIALSPPCFCPVLARRMTLIGRKSAAPDPIRIVPVRHWRSEKAMCDSGDVVEGSLFLEVGYTLGELKVLINGEEIELEMLSVDRYAFSFTFHFNSKVSFEGAPELAKESGI